MAGVLNDRVFLEKIYGTLMGNKQYPQLKLEKVNDNFLDYSAKEICILYGRRAFKIKVEMLPGYHEDLTTI